MRETIRDSPNRKDDRRKRNRCCCPAGTRPSAADRPRPCWPCSPWSAAARRPGCNRHRPTRSAPRSSATATCPAPPSPSPSPWPIRPTRTGPGPAPEPGGDGHEIAGYDTFTRCTGARIERRDVPGADGLLRAGETAAGSGLPARRGDADRPGPPDRRGPAGAATGGGERRRVLPGDLPGGRQRGRHALRGPARRDGEIAGLVLAEGVRRARLPGPDQVGRAAGAVRPDRGRRRHAVVRRDRGRAGHRRVAGRRPGGRPAPLGRPGDLRRLGRATPSRSTRRRRWPRWRRSARSSGTRPSSTVASGIRRASPPPRCATPAGRSPPAAACCTGRPTGTPATGRRAPRSRPTATCSPSRCPAARRRPGRSRWSAAVSWSPSRTGGRFRRCTPICPHRTGRRRWRAPPAVTG